MSQFWGGCWATCPCTAGSASPRGVPCKVIVHVATRTSRLVESRHGKRLSRCPALPVPDSCNHWSVLPFCNFVISGMWYGRNHTVCDLWGLDFFHSAKNALEIRPGYCVCFSPFVACARFGDAPVSIALLFLKTIWIVFSFWLLWLKLLLTSCTGFCVNMSCLWNKYPSVQLLDYGSYMFRVIRNAKLFSGVAGILYTSTAMYEGARLSFITSSAFRVVPAFFDVAILMDVHWQRLVGFFFFFP